MSSPSPPETRTAHNQPVGAAVREIVNLTWDRVDLKRGFITLRALDTKTKTARQIPILPDVRAILQRLAKVRSLATRHVFTYDGQPIRGITRTFKTALREAGIRTSGFTICATVLVPISGGPE